MQQTERKLKFQISDFILKIQIEDTSGKKFYKNSCSLLDKKKLNDIFSILKTKYNIPIPEDLIEETGWALG